MIHKIDITQEHCPMTFVKTKIKLAQIAQGDILEVTLKAGEPLDNVPRSAAEQGFTILATKQIDENTYQIKILK